MSDKYEPVNQLPPHIGTLAPAPFPPPTPVIVRVDKYTITIDGFRVRCDPGAAEDRIRGMTPEQLSRFKRIMGG